MSLKGWRRPQGRAVVRCCLQWMPWLVLVGVVGLRADSARETTPAQAQGDALAKQAYQVLKASCFECHGDAKRGGLDLRTAQSLAAGGTTGKVVVAHDPEKSRLYQFAATEHEGRVQLPGGAKISEADLDTLRAWIEAGGSLDGIDPNAAAAESKRSEDRPIKPEEREYWAFKPAVRAALPAVRTAGWS